ncbi:MAG TPA: metallophosphoesterase family protein, partial [Polyangiaceae bacterium]|nr:metallophosphoesterase family protein [Polyangiaceae bacterium]
MSRSKANLIAPRTISTSLLAILAAVAGSIACTTHGQTGMISEDPSVSTRQRLTSLTLLPLGSEWKYNDLGVDPGVGWNQPSWDDSSWKVGRGEFGYGDGDEATTINNKNGTARVVTTYFRTSFQISDPSEFAGVSLSITRDDAVAVYLNGVEVFRNNLPNATIAYGDRATRDVTMPEESVPIEIDVSASLAQDLLVAGQNVIAAEVHQGAQTTDLSFELGVQAIPIGVVRGPYLQNGTPNSAVISWRTSAPTISRVRWGKRPGVLAHEVIDPTPTVDHAVTVTGLEPDQTYYYAVGSDSALFVGDDEQHFLKTLPQPGQSKPTRIWVVADPSTGWGGADPKAVRDAYVRGLGANRYTDVMLFPGDQAYYAGDDYSYTRQIFNMYGDFLRSSFSWSEIGNHDTHTATADADVALAPYFKIYTLPTQGEAGGVASQSERYYSFDYGDIHFVGLDTQTMIDGAYPEAMLSWLEADLAANNRQWIVTYLHKSPYSKGQHSSDADA